MMFINGQCNICIVYKKDLHSICIVCLKYPFSRLYFWGRFLSSVTREVSLDARTAHNHEEAAWEKNNKILLLKPEV